MLCDLDTDLDTDLDRDLDTGGRTGTVAKPADHGRPLDWHGDRPPQIRILDRRPVSTPPPAIALRRRRNPASFAGIDRQSVCGHEEGGVDPKIDRPLTHQRSPS